MADDQTETQLKSVYKERSATLGAAKWHTQAVNKYTSQGKVISH